MDIKRQQYLDQLIASQRNGLIKIITGIRRCGKSYLLFKLFHEYLNSQGISDDHIIEVALDDRTNKELRDPDNLLKYIKEQITDKNLYYIMLDEVQMVDEFTDVLNSLLHISNADVYVTGSNSHFLSTDVVTEFRGEVMRYIYFHCHSLNTVKDIKGQQTMHGKIIIHTEGFLLF